METTLIVVRRWTCLEEDKRYRAVRPATALLGTSKHVDFVITSESALSPRTCYKVKLEVTDIGSDGTILANVVSAKQSRTLDPKFYI